MISSRRLRPSFVFLAAAFGLLVSPASVPMAQQDGSDRGCKETCARREASCIRQAEQRYFGSDPMTQELEVFSYCREVQETCEERAGLDFDSLCTDVKSCMQQVKKQLDEKFRAATDLCASDERECVAQCA